MLEAFQYSMATATAADPQIKCESNHEHAAYLSLQIRTGPGSCGPGLLWLQLFSAVAEALLFPWRRCGQVGERCGRGGEASTSSAVSGEGVGAVGRGGAVRAEGTLGGI